MNSSLMNPFKFHEKCWHSFRVEKLCVELLSIGSNNAYTNLSKTKLMLDA